MARQVSGYIAEDEKFFEAEAECQRYEAWTEITKLCESHNVNPQNFFELIHEWNEQIRRYYNADSYCVEKRAKAKGRIEFVREDEDQPESLPQVGDDNSYSTVGVETDAGVLELPIRRHERVSNVRSGTRTEAVPSARESTGS